MPRIRRLSVVAGSRDAEAVVEQAQQRRQQTAKAFYAELGRLQTEGLPRDNASRNRILGNLRRYLSEGCNVNQPSPDNILGVHVAARVNFVPLLELLLSFDADLTKPHPKSGDTALHEAVRYLSTESLEFLVREECALDAKNSRGQTPAHVLADRVDYTFQTDTVMGRILSHCDVNAKDGNGRTLLHIAAIRGHAMLVQRLLQRAVMTTARDNFDQPALNALCCVEDLSISHVECAQLLCQSLLVHVDDMSPRTVVRSDTTTSPSDDKTPQTPLQLVLYNATTDFAEGIAGHLVQRGAHKGAPGGGSPPLLVACRRASVAMVTYLLGLGFDADATDEEGNTCLIAAVREKREDVVALLLKHSHSLLDAPTNEKAVRPPTHAVTVAMSGKWARQGDTALHWAAYLGLSSSAEALLEAGASWAARNLNGNTPVDVAAPEVRKVFATYIAGYTTWDSFVQNAAGMDGKTHDAVALVSSAKLLQMVDLWNPERETLPMDQVGQLFEEGADPNVVGADGTPVYAVAILKLHGKDEPSPTAKNRVQAICDAISTRQGFSHALRLRKHDAATLLHCAAMLDLKTCTSALLSLGAEVNAVDARGKTPMAVAAMLGSSQAALVLLKAGANPRDAMEHVMEILGDVTAPSAECIHMLLENTKLRLNDAAYRIPVRVACLAAIGAANVECLKRLLKLGAPHDGSTKAVPEFGVESGTTLLLFAAAKLFVPGMEALLEAGANVLQTDVHGSTALHVVCRQRPTFATIKATGLLLQHGADPSVLDATGHSPLSLACMHAGESLAMKAIVPLVSAKADVGWQREGESLLFLSLMVPEGSMFNYDAQMSIAKYLVSHGADVDAPICSTGDAALHVVASRGMGTHVTALLELGASSLAVNSRGETPLHVALGASPYDDDSCKSLLEDGLEREGKKLPNMADNNGQTPLHRAVIGDHDLMVQALVSAGAVATRDEKGKLPYDYLAFSSSRGMDDHLLHDNDKGGKKSEDKRLRWRRRLDIIFGAVSLFARFTQTSAFVFTLNLAWARDYASVVNMFAASQLYLPGVDVPYVFLVTFVLSWIYIFLGGIMFKTLRRTTPAAAATKLTAEIGFVPIVRVLMLCFVCRGGTVAVDAGIACWAGVAHLILVPLCAVSLLWYITAAVRLSRVDFHPHVFQKICSFHWSDDVLIIHKQQFHPLMKRVDSRIFDTIVIPLKLAMVSVSLFLETFELLAVMLLSFLSVVQFSIIWIFPSFVQHRTNSLQSGLILSVVVTNFAGLATRLVNDADVAVTMHIWVACLFVGGAVGFAANHFCNRKSRKGEAEAMQSALAKAMRGTRYEEEVAKRMDNVNVSSEYSDDEEFAATFGKRRSSHGKRLSISYTGMRRTSVTAMPTVSRSSPAFAVSTSSTSVPPAARSVSTPIMEVPSRPAVAPPRPSAVLESDIEDDFEEMWADVNFDEEFGADLFGDADDLFAEEVAQEEPTRRHRKSSSGRTEAWAD